MSLSVPQLRTLEIERFHPTTWDTILVASLENIRISDAGDERLKTLCNIFARCPLALRVLLWYGWGFREEDQHLFQVFVRGPPPALRKVELRIAERDLERILKTGLFNAGLDTLAVYFRNEFMDDFELLSSALLPGLEPIIVFKSFDSSQIELRRS
ncbi:hypothetical protein C8R44DRAFT_895297 [Mycena epipterygia]|nr:hypothetical protein C8R44DRAFT_895297 [Mycena epipterygia]